MRIIFNSKIKPNIKIINIYEGLIQVNSHEEINIYRRKINSQNEWVFVGKTIQGIFESELITEWYEFTIGQGDFILLDVYKFMPKSIQLQMYDYSQSASSVLHKLPDNLYKKDDINSNTFNVVTSLGKEIDKIYWSAKWSDRIKSFYPYQPLEPDKINYFKDVMLERPFWNDTELFENDSTHPTEYIKAGNSDSLSFGFNELNFLHSEIPRKITDETGVEHECEFVLYPDSNYMTLQHSDNADLVGTYFLYNELGEALSDIRGLDCCYDNLYILTKDKLLSYSLPSFTYGNLRPFLSCKVSISADAFGLKIGNSFFVTKDKKYEVYKSMHYSFSRKDGVIITYGDVKSLTDMCDDERKQVLNFREQKINTYFDAGCELFSFERLDNVRAANFLIALSKVNVYSNFRSNDSNSNLLLESGILHQRNRLVNMQYGIPNFKTKKKELKRVLDSIYCDNYKSLIWGGKYD
jgi:hypothetical protein